MVLTVLKGLGKAYLKSKGKNLLGSKTVAEWKVAASAAKLKAVQSDLKESFKKVNKTFDKLETTLKKQKKILDD